MEQEFAGPEGRWRPVRGALVRLEATPACLVGSFGSTLVIVWRGETDEAAVQRLESHLNELRRTAGPDLGLLTIVEPESAVPSSEVRAQTAEVIRRASLRFSALAFEGSDFRGTIVRCVVAGIALVARPGYPHRTFARVEAASDWIETVTAQGPGELVGSLVLARAVRTLRAAA